MEFYSENPSLVHGVVYMGSGNMVGDALAGVDVPALVLRGSRDPFCPPEVRARGKRMVVPYFVHERECRCFLCVVCLSFDSSDC